MGERRPLQSRDARWAKATASFLAARRFPPNAISIFSVVFAAIAGAAFIGSTLCGADTPVCAFCTDRSVCATSLLILGAISTAVNGVPGAESNDPAFRMGTTIGAVLVGGGVAVYGASCFLTGAFALRDLKTLLRRRASEA